jgi:hypothetical protein
VVSVVIFSSDSCVACFTLPCAVASSPITLNASSCSGPKHVEDLLLIPHPFQPPRMISSVPKWSSYVQSMEGCLLFLNFLGPFPTLPLIFLP